VLIVEDTPLHQKVLRKVLMVGFPGVEVITSSDAYEGYGILLGIPDIDIIFLDHNMPFATGASLLEKIRSVKALSSIPVVIITGEDIPKENFLDKGANAYFGKPFNPKSLKEVISSLDL
jgi:CheY-like chemotaxis protein